MAAAHFPSAEVIPSLTHINEPVLLSRCHFSLKLAQTILITPFTSTAHLACRMVKLLTWDLGKAATFKILGYHTESSNDLQTAYLKTVQVFRDILLIPTRARSAFNDMVRKSEPIEDDLKVKEDYLTTSYNKQFYIFSSYMYGRKAFEVIRPVGIHEFAAESDGTLNTVMASHFLKPGVLAINFGIPNVATFTTEKREDGTSQTIKVDAKSLKREPMTFHATNGKMQSGLFFVPTNLPEEALDRFRKAALKLQGSADITCVNTNCKVLEEAGFSIEGKNMKEVVFPTTFMEHLLFRNVFYTDNQGKKHKVHFDIINTTPHGLEEHFDKIDLAVVGTRFRHRQRNKDTEENRKARGVAAKALIEIERMRLAEADEKHRVENTDFTRRKVTVSVPSYLGDAITRVWGRHTVYEVHLADKKEEIAHRFKDLAKLRPFPQRRPSCLTRLKRDLFFSKPMINFLRRHMMGHMDTLHLNTQDLLSHLKTTQGERLNYVLLDDKVVLARVNANGNKKDIPRKAADWALSKHALLAGRQEVFCSGEVWYDKNNHRFMMNRDSGTYMPEKEHVEIAKELANQIFQTNLFEVVGE